MYVYNWAYDRIVDGLKGLCHGWVKFILLSFAKYLKKKNHYLHESKWQNHSFIATKCVSAGRYNFKLQASKRD